MSVPRMCRHHRWQIRLYVLGPSRDGPHDIRHRRARRHIQHRTPRYGTEWREQEMDMRGAPHVPKQRIASPIRLGEGRIAQRFDLQQRLELCKLARWLPDAAILTLFACLASPADPWPLAIRRYRQLPRHRLGSGFPLACLRQSPVGCSRQRRRLRWARRHRDSARPPSEISRSRRAPRCVALVLRLRRGTWGRRMTRLRISEPRMTLYFEWVSHSCRSSPKKNPTFYLSSLWGDETLVLFLESTNLIGLCFECGGFLLTVCALALELPASSCN